MEERRYRIVTCGEIAAGEDPDEVRERVRRLCRYRLEVLDRVFYGKPFVLKSDLDRENAGRYLKALAGCGLVCRVLPMTPPEAPAKPAVTAAAVPSAVGL